MVDLSVLRNKTIAVCFVYGDDGDLFLHCVGAGLFKDNALFVERGKEEDPFCVSDYQPILVKEIASDKRTNFKGADYLVVFRVIARLEDFQNKRFAIQLSDEGQALHVFVGDSRYSEKILYLDFGQNRNSFVICRDWYPRIKAVSNEQKEELDDAIFVLSLKVGSIPIDADLMKFQKTGLRIPLRD